MPILKLIAGLPELSLAPEDIEALIEAYDSVVLALKIDRAGPGAEWVAKQVIAVAKLGERDPLEIGTLVVASFQAKKSNLG